MTKLAYIRRQVARAITLTSVVLGAAMIVMVWSVIVWKYHDQAANDHGEAVQNNRNLALLFEENVLRSIEQVDQALGHLRRLIEEKTDATDFHQLLTRPHFTSEIITQFSIIDADGILRASSLNDKPLPLDLSDREHYRFHRGRTSDDLFISEAVVGRGSGLWFVPLTRRLRKADGSFGGVVLGALKPEHLSEFYKSIDLGPSGSIALVGLADGRVRATGGANEHGRFEIGQDLSGSRLLNEIRSRPAGTFVEKMPGAGNSRIVTYRQIRGHPLAVSISVSRAQVYAQARSDVLLHAIVGAVLTLMIVMVSIRGARSQLRLRLATAHANRSERRARQKSEQLRLTLDNMDQGIFMVAKDHRIPVINRQAARLLDLPEEFLRHPPKFEDLIRYQEARGEYAALPLPEGMTAAEYFARRDGEGGFPTYDRVRPNGLVLEVRTRPLPDGGFVRTFTDVTHRRQAQEAVVRLASEDALTGLANRQQFKEDLAKCALRQQPSQSGGEEEHAGFALLCVDVDGFKIINETLGLWIGDGLLQAVAERLKQAVRAGNVVARLGGDEFAVLLPRTRSTEQPEAMAKHLAEVLTAPYDVHGQHIRIGISIGIAIAPHDGNDPELLLKAGEMALYAAKAAGRGTYRFFHKSMAEQLRVRRQLELDLRSAIDNDELSLHYQPLINIAGNTISGFEALMRWEHPLRGPVSPAEFIPIAEETGLIVSLGAWAIRKACEQAAAWPADIRVAVNVSPTQFRSANLVATVSDILRETGLGPDRLELEITETLLMQDSETTMQSLHQLRDLGVRISMDDFGTGYSSLSYLRIFPLSKIKIDRAFVKDLGTSEASDIIIRSIIDIASTLKMTTTAEGVETRKQLECLNELGCSEAQGYYLSKPVPAAQVSEIIARWSRPSPIAA